MPADVMAGVDRGRRVAVRLLVTSTVEHVCCDRIERGARPVVRCALSVLMAI